MIELLTVALGGGPAGERPPEFFRWKHLDNPFGRSFMLVAEAERRIIGLRAFMRWTFRADGRSFPAVRAVDTATHPEYQGQGVFSRLTREALEALRSETAFVFNTPNEKSLPGYLKLGWQEVGAVPVWIRVRRPLRFARGLRSLRADSAMGSVGSIQAETAAQALEDEGAISDLLQASPGPDGRLATTRTVEYLRWRYGRAPLLDYRAVSERGAGSLNGLAVFRVRPRGRLREATISEVIHRPGDAKTVRRLVHRVAAAARVDHLTHHVSGWPAGAAARSGFVRSPLGLTLVVNPMRSHLRPDPADLRSWAFSLGDLEVF